MSKNPEQQKILLTEKVISRVRDKLDYKHVEQVETFIRRYYERVAPEDLVDRSVLDLYGAALAAWNLAHRRRPGQHLVHVYNPRMEEHGWQSTHTIIEVVAEDMPFLVDSVRMLLNRHGLTVHIIVHPVLRILRNEQHEAVDIVTGDAPTEGEAVHEAIMHFEVDRQTDPAVLEQIQRELDEVLHDVRAAVEDWQPMRERLEGIIEEIEASPPPKEAGDVEEAKAFLRWLAADHFTFLGSRGYKLRRADGADELRVIGRTGLGILRDDGDEHVSTAFGQLPPEARQLARRPQLLILTKSGSVSTVHRPVHLDYIGIKRFDKKGHVVGEWRFLGLYTAAAYNRIPQEIPILRKKVAHVMDCSGLRANSHSAKALLNILETLPRAELFQSSDDELCATAMGILHLQERQRVRLFVRKDPFQRFLACLIYLPRDRYDTSVRLRIQAILRDAFNASSVDFTVFLSESVLARLYLVAHTDPGNLPEFDTGELELRLAEAIRSWDDGLHDSLLWELGEARGTRLYHRYRSAFPGSYKDDYPAAMAVHDIDKIEALGPDEPLGMALYRPLEAPEGALRFKLFCLSEPIALSVVLPMLENMGVKVIDQRPHKIRRSDDLPVWLQDIGMIYGGGQLDTEQIRQIFQEAFLRIWRGDVENDGFNRLVLRAHMSWREVAILRTYCKYILQTGFPFSQAYMEQALAKHPQIASLLVNLFTTRFDPAKREHADQRAERLAHAIQESLDAVPNLDEDRIQRRFFALIQATLRTNFFQKDAGGASKPYISIKLDPTDIPDLPLPRPQYEVFVYSPRVEGVHLRGGRVARGGIRWSDRLEDFRTEIFGLMKAQMVKNAVIVPVGAKGGFVVKRPPNHDRELLMQEVKGCYRTFICGLLDITDNLDGSRVVPPPDVVRHDGDDPYLVVAADKGTATFSDIANDIAASYGFWLGDAFASGGSTGYDHKKMGITARGAWESVKRHFRELGTDVQTTDFTVAGIGSMNGDVFGNGMLLSRHIRLVAAFSHSHIFLDPDPDTEATYRERQRLFELPRSSWDDYDRALISEGGGLFPRSAKSIPLSPQVRERLGIEAESLPPNELIRAILRAPVDLLWNGGIGTFVKACSETHEAAGDRTNDAIRVNASELRCLVIGEGGNLGITQRGRIEYAANGGKINTDFIDNSGGVDCSDHEVNIKILLDQVVRDGDMSQKQRNKLLVDMTEEVADLVLHNNYQQTAALSMSDQQAPVLLEEHAGFIRRLERTGRLERVTWQLPDDEEIAARRTAGQGLTRPELSVLLAYSKIDLFDALLDSDVSEDPYLGQELITYFPKPIGQRYADRLQGHRLRREIVVTFIANSMVNRMGITFPYRIQEYSGADVPDIARAYTIARRIYELPELWRQVEGLDNLVDSGQQNQMLRDIRKLVNRSTLWLLRNRKQPLSISDAVEAFEGGVQELKGALPELLDPEDRDHLEIRAGAYRARGVPKEIAVRFAFLPPLFSALDITDVATAMERPVTKVARLYFLLGAELELHWMRDQITALSTADRWSRLARAALREDLVRLQRIVTQDTLDLVPDEHDPAEQMRIWMETNHVAVEQYLARLAEFKSSGAVDLALLSVALNEVRKLLRITESAGS